ncbi:MAG TPA: YncE family protein [Gemmatimonadota bacterium]|nr:YncE family protein [Gemmatimonadota bacterium]
MRVISASASLLAVLAGVSACATTGAGQPGRAGGPGGGETGPAGEGPYLYVANQNGASISIIEVDDPRIVESVDLQALGFGPNARPHDTAVDPDGSHWYVTLIGENRVLKFDNENRLVGQVEMEVPGLIVTHPTDDLLVVGRSMTAVSPPSSVALIRRSDMTLLEEVEVVFPRPHALAIGRSGRWAYTASLAENRIAAIDLETGDVNLIEVPGAATEPVDGVHEGREAYEGREAHEGHESHGGQGGHTIVEFALSPDGRTMVAGGELSGELLFLDLSDPAAPAVAGTLDLGGAPWHPAYTPDGRTIYVPLHQADQVAVVDANAREVVTRIEGRGLAEPHGAAPSPDGRWVFVSNNNTGGGYVPDGEDPVAGTVVVIDAATLEVAKILEVGPNAAGIEIGSTP